MTGPTVVVEASGISVQQSEPMTRAEARHIGLRLLEAATVPERVTRRRVTVDEAFRDREGGA